MSSSQEKINLLIEKAEINRDNARKRMRLVISLCILFPIVYLGIVSLIIKSKQTELIAIETELAAKKAELAAKKAELAEATTITEEQQATIEQASEQVQALEGLSNDPEFEQTLTALNEILGSYRIKIRYTRDIKSSEENALKIRDLLQQEMKIKNVEIEGIDEDKMRFYWYVQGYKIRFDKETEEKKAEDLQKVIKSSLGLEIALEPSTIPSPNFISIFLGS